jgi:hypothetical protein
MAIINFLSKRYEDDLGFQWLVRLSELFVTIAGAEAAVDSPKNVGVHVKSSKSNNSYGVRPRHLILENKEGTEKQKRTVPVLKQSVFTSIAINQEFTIGAVEGQGGTVYVVKAKKGEKRDAN